ncbi:MAG: hypothetical protein ACI854_000243 [Arenicella sp.]|jgi:hypothetical protein
MLEQRQPKTENNEASFDVLMASLFVLVTHHSLTQCQNSLRPIVEQLNSLCQHSEIEYYPNQLKVLAKMRQLWQTKLFDAEFDGLRH